MNEYFELLGTFQESGVIQEAYNLNHPLLLMDCGQPASEYSTNT